MPLYEYECEACGKRFERWSKETRDFNWTEICPEEGAVARRVISPFSFALKGGGWYKDGYQKEKPKGKTDSSGPSSKPEEV